MTVPVAALPGGGREDKTDVGPPLRRTATWITGLALGVVTCVMLNHVYGYEFT